MSNHKKPANGFKPGQSGNPLGKVAGDLTAAKLVIERIAPPSRERPISIDLPSVGTAAGINDAQAAIV
jgi:hypothetical protein